jgi:hypothetical protein
MINSELTALALSEDGRFSFVHIRKGAGAAMTWCVFRSRQERSGHLSPPSTSQGHGDVRYRGWSGSQ